MLPLIKRDLKQRIKNPLTWFIILILCIMSMLNIIEMKEKRLNRPFKGHDPFSFETIGVFDWTQDIDERERKIYPKAYYSKKIKTDTGKQILKSNEENNTKEIVKSIAFMNLLWAKEYFISSDVIMNTVFEQKVIDIWNDVSGGIEYEDIDFRPFSSINDVGKYWDLLVAKYYHQLYTNNLLPIYSDDVNNITYLYDYLFNIVPSLILIIAIISIYNTINKEKNSGSLKLIVTQSFSRWKYYISKWIGGVIHIIFIISLPAITISNILGALNGFVSMKYPTLYLKGAMTTFKPIPNYLDIIKSNVGQFPKFMPSTFSHYAPRTATNLFYDNLHSKMETILFYKYLLIVILLTILFIAFAVAFTQLISAIINKELISFAVVSSIFVVGILVSSPFKYEKHLNLSPFTMENASRIVIGTHNVTALTSIIILLLSTVLLLFIGCKYFKKKDI